MLLISVLDNLLLLLLLLFLSNLSARVDWLRINEKREASSILERPLFTLSLFPSHTHTLFLSLFLSLLARPVLCTRTVRADIYRVYS